MDTNTIALILTALTTGAAAGLADSANQAVKDGYGKLKSLLQKKLAGSSTALLALEEHEKQPTIWKAPLEEGLRIARADQDEEIMAAAHHVLTLIHTHQAGTGNILVQNQGTVQGQVIENSGSVTMHFGETPRTQE